MDKPDLDKGTTISLFVSLPPFTFLSPRSSWSLNLLFFIQFLAGSRSEGVDMIEELSLDQDGSILSDDKGDVEDLLEGDFSPSTITKEGTPISRYKVIVIGDSGVGKTGFFFIFIHFKRLDFISFS